MAAVVPIGRRQLTRGLCTVNLLFWFLFVRTASGSALGVFEYRFIVPPDVSMEPNETRARHLIEKLRYTSPDKEHLWHIARRLEPHTAASFLDDYQREYAKRNELLDSTWGRAVFCLGMVQARSARDRLLKLWDEYDRLLATDKIKITPRSIGRELRPLLVIGDALHFYLWDSAVREWFEGRIRELDTLPKSEPLNLAREARRTDRQHLIGRLLTWDIVESVDEGPVIVPERLTAFSPFTQPHVRNMQKAADNAVGWAGRMQPLHRSVSLEEWRRIRRSPWEPSFDEVCGHLGMAIWRQYLSDPNRPVLNENRVWHTALLALLHTIDDRSEQSWEPDAQETQMLEDAITFATRPPEGHFQRLIVRCLFMMSAYAPDETANVQLKRIRDVADGLLDERTRANLRSNAAMNRLMECGGQPLH